MGSAVGRLEGICFALLVKTHTCGHELQSECAYKKQGLEVMVSIPQ